MAYSEDSRLPRASVHDTSSLAQPDKGRALEAWRRRYIWNGYCSLTALGSGTIGSMDGRAYLRACLVREEAEGIAPAVVEEARQAVRAAIRQRDVTRLGVKGVLPQGEQDI